MVREVPLTRGLVALVDDEDYELVSQFKWRAIRPRNVFYAYRTFTVDEKRFSQYMHQLITGYQLTDHRDRDGLNNTRENLREATVAQNALNVTRRRNTSGFLGVAKSGDRWAVRMRVGGKMTAFGEFDDLLDAAIIRDHRAREHQGEFAPMNFSRNFHASLQETLAAFEAAA